MRIAVVDPPHAPHRHRAVARPRAGRAIAARVLALSAMLAMLAMIASVFAEAHREDARALGAVSAPLGPAIARTLARVRADAFEASQRTRSAAHTW